MGAVWVTLVMEKQAETGTGTGKNPGINTNPLLYPFGRPQTCTGLQNDAAPEAATAYRLLVVRLLAS
ncbi:hypothetical protein GCM10011430_02500 [Oxalicibacterium solurbis]|uniref:Uncharacterized protein n=1 Tax=Oxalicibacterium solurbis TaxID=69280 RepID=A0A8J3AWY3_9BURK|nr:hypothetical protein GCM10011430_02500 [Oxalicibacterium solurbis]